MAGDTRIGCDEFLDLAAGVALDATDEADERRVEAHAARCSACMLKLHELQAVAGLLGMVAPQVDPPAALRQRVLEVARREPRRARVRRLWPRALRRPRVSAAWLVAAASMLVSLVSIAWLALLQSQIVSLQHDAAMSRERAVRYENMVEVLASDKLAIRPLQPMVQTMPSRGMVYLDPSSGTGMVMCHALPAVAQGHAYQVWFMRGSERVSGGLLWPDPNGNGYTLIQVPTDLASFDAIGLTEEPGTGSAWPTSPGVMGSPLKERSQ